MLKFVPTQPHRKPYTNSAWFVVAIVICIWFVSCPGCVGTPEDKTDSREEVIFWHFWGGADGKVVDDAVRRFNESQYKYRVRAIAMPGNNLDTKLFLSIAGGDPPDLVNQDDPIVADWAYRGIIERFDDFVSGEELAKVTNHLLPSARRLGQFDNGNYAIANGLDIRALLYNKTHLEENNLTVPQTIEQFNDVCNSISPPGKESREFYAYLPDARRLWTWGYVFGGRFVDPASNEANFDDGVYDALDWMQGFTDSYGEDNIAAFRTGDQSLPGKTFPLLPTNDDAMVGRYVFVLAGQWNTRDVNEFQLARKQKNITFPEFGVCPLPYPSGGRAKGGWVNGNVFVVPKNAGNKKGAWEFVKFWIGSTNPDEAAKTCAQGGWIPTHRQVIESATFQDHLDEHPLFAEFVELAKSENQFAYPMIPGAPFYVRTLNASVESVLGDSEREPRAELDSAEKKIQQHLHRVLQNYRREDYHREENAKEPNRDPK